MKSLYLLQFTNGDPAELAWSEHHLVTTPETLRTLIDELCQSPAKRRGHCFWFDTVIGVWVIRRGEVSAFIDLRGVIKVPSKEASLEQLIADDFDPETSSVPSLKVDWRAASKLLPPLEAPLMERDDTLAFAHHPHDPWLAGRAGATLGSHFRP